MPLTSIVATLAAACAVNADATRARTTSSPRPNNRDRRIDVLPSRGYMPAAM